MRNAPSLLVQG